MNLHQPLVTIELLSDLAPRPTHAVDHTGKRRGTMTAVAWCRASRSGKGTVWICRCDCGHYEHRRPGTWASRPFPEDTCDVCQKAKGPNARKTAPERLRLWIDDLRSRGLNDQEIAQIQAPGMSVRTIGMSAAEIREQLEKPAT